MYDVTFTRHNWVSVVVARLELTISWVSARHFNQLNYTTKTFLISLINFNQANFNNRNLPVNVSQ